MNKKWWYLGVDPGFGESGLVLLDNRLAVRAYATATCKPRGKSDVARACSLGGHIVDLVHRWVHDYGVQYLVVGMELPVLTKNAVNFAKQVRLVQEIESGLLMVVTGVLDAPGSCVLLEFQPSVSKKAATGCGNADKTEVIAASPFAVFPEKLLNPTREALADAWAHATVAVHWERHQAPVVDVVDLTTEFAAIVDEPVLCEE